MCLDKLDPANMIAEKENEDKYFTCIICRNILKDPKECS